MKNNKSFLLSALFCLPFISSVFAAPEDGLVIDATGNIGIRTAPPVDSTDQIQMEGNVLLTGNIVVDGDVFLKDEEETIKNIREFESVKQIQVESDLPQNPTEGTVYIDIKGDLKVFTKDEWKTLAYQTNLTRPGLILHLDASDIDGDGDSSNNLAGEITLS